MVDLLMARFPRFPGCLTKVLALCCCMAGSVARPVPAATQIPKWGRFEATLESSANYGNPVQEAVVSAEFTSPKGEVRKVPGFLDGAKTWRIRFAPNQTGRW